MPCCKSGSSDALERAVGAEVGLPAGFMAGGVCAPSFPANEKHTKQLQIAFLPKRMTDSNYKCKVRLIALIDARKAKQLQEWIGFKE